MNYSYDKGIVYAKSLGLDWQEAWVENFDQMAKAHGFTQAQVDVAVQNHLAQIAHIFNRKIYTLGQRIKIAAWFIFGAGRGIEGGK